MVVDAPGAVSERPRAGGNLGGNRPWNNNDAAAERKKNTVQSERTLSRCSYPSNFLGASRTSCGGRAQDERKEVDPPSFLSPSLLSSGAFKRKGIPPLMPFDTSHL